MYKYISIIAVLILLFSSCKEGDDFICTTEFVTIGVTVEGTALTDYYTVQESTSDTVRPVFTVDNNFYPIIDDNCQPKLNGKIERFIFHGFINSTQVVEEGYLLEADRCHVRKVSGPSTITP